jgi:aspartate kinase
MEELVLTGLASTPGQAKLVLRGLPAGMRTQTELLEALAGAGVSVDMANESFDGDGRMQLQLTIAAADAEKAEGLVRGLIERWGSGHLAAHRGLSRIAMVGNGMTGRPGVYARAYRALLEAGVEVQGASTSSISISVLVPTEREDDALRALHDAFVLEASGSPAAVAER